MASRLVNEAPKYFVMVVWAGLNVFLFVYFFLFYLNGPQFYYVRSYVGLALPFARACAAPLNFNCMLILLPVCRNMLSFIKGSCKCCKRSISRPLDKNIAFHKIVAYTICFFTAVHAVAHVFNVEYFVSSWDPLYRNTSGKEHYNLITKLNSLNGSWINPVSGPDKHPIAAVLGWFPGVTGVVITLALILMVTSATETIRRSYFEVFWYTHHLFVVFFIGLVVHGLFGVVRTQINTANHDPEVCSKTPSTWGVGSQCSVPEFSSSTPQTWMWVIAPMVLYIAERCIRIWRKSQKVVISKVIKHPSKVIEIQMKKNGFKMAAGEYIFVNCPHVARFEWHPFTLTSAPEEDYFSVHIRQVGDWTNALTSALCVDESQSKPLPRIAVDGPFGTASEDVFRYDVDILVGTGIGVTPFASILKHIWYQMSNDKSQKLKKVYFFWICPNTNAFEWFSDLLQELENKMGSTEGGLSEFLDYNIYLTRGWDADMARNIAMHNRSIKDPITGLRQKTHYGRPNWPQIFTQLSQDHPNTRVGVFFCGPKVLSSTLHKQCNEFSSSNPSETQFVFNKENF